MIMRLWQVWTHPKDTDAYEQLLKTKISSRARTMKGYVLRKIRPVRRSRINNIQFIAFSQFGAVKSARPILKRSDSTAQRFHLRHLSAGGSEP